MYKPDHNRAIFKFIPGAVALIQQDKCISCKQPVDQATLTSSDIQNEYIQTGLCPQCQNSIPVSTVTPPPPPPSPTVPLPPKSSHIVLVIDRSGSMKNLALAGWAEGFVQVIAEQKQLAQAENRTIYVTLCTFDDTATTYLDRVNVENVPNYNQAELFAMFSPRNTTRLVDTMYEQIENAAAHHRQANQRFGADNVNCTVMCWTDGKDNASLRTVNQLNILITNFRKNPNVVILFIAANQDAITAGQAMGISAANCLTCSNTPAQAPAVFRAVTQACARGTSGGVAAFTQLERESTISASPTPLAAGGRGTAAPAPPRPSAFSRSRTC